MGCSCCNDRSCVVTAGVAVADVVSVAGVVHAVVQVAVVIAYSYSIPARLDAFLFGIWEATPQYSPFRPPQSNGVRLENRSDLIRLF